MNFDDLGTKAAFGVGLAWLARLGLSALRKQGLADSTIESHATALTNATAEAKKWEDRYNESQKNHESNLMLIGELRTQNRMLRMLLIQHGATHEAIDKALEVPDGVA